MKHFLLVHNIIYLEQDRLKTSFNIDAEVVVVVEQEEGYSVTYHLQAGRCGFTLTVDTNKGFCVLCNGTSFLW